MRYVCECLICKAKWVYPAETDESTIRASCSPCGHGGCFTVELEMDNLVEKVHIESINFEEEVKKHPNTEECEEMKNSGECIICGFRDCPHHEPLHFHHDGCPACIGDEE